MLIALSGYLVDSW